MDPLNPLKDLLKNKKEESYVSYYFMTSIVTWSYLP